MHSGSILFAHLLPFACEPCSTPLDFPGQHLAVAASHHSDYCGFFILGRIGLAHGIDSPCCRSLTRVASPNGRPNRIVSRTLSFFVDLSANEYGFAHDCVQRCTLYSSRYLCCVMYFHDESKFTVALLRNLLDSLSVTRHDFSCSHMVALSGGR